MNRENTELERESVLSKEQRLEEYQKLLELLCEKQEVLSQHGINTQTLIKILKREIHILNYQLNE